MELNVSSNKMIKNVILVELDVSIKTAFFLEYMHFKDDLIEEKSVCVTAKKTSTSLTKN